MKFKPYRYTLQILTEEEDKIMNEARKKKGLRQSLKDRILKSMEIVNTMEAVDVEYKIKTNNKPNNKPNKD